MFLLYRPITRCIVLAMLSFVWATSVVPARAGQSPSDQHPDKVEMGETAHRNVVVATGPWPPYAVEDGMSHGTLGKILEIVFNRAGYGVEFQFHPWPRSLKDSLEGTADALMPAYCSAERAENYFCSDEVVTGRMVFFRLRETPPVSWEKITDLAEMPIGATMSYYYGDEFQAAEAAGEIRVIRIPSDVTNMKLLLKGRIKLYPQDALVGDEIIRAHFEPEEQALLTHDNKSLHDRPIHVLFTRANPRGEHLTQVFNDGLEKLRKSGELDALLKPLIGDHNH